MTISPLFRNVLLGTAAVALVAPLAITAHPQVAKALGPASTQAPGSFADIVDHVKPAVISVRVTKTVAAQNMGYDEQQMGQGEDDPLGELLRRFGERGMRGGPRGGGHGPVQMSQGSGFFISADGYAVTNNHVVEGVKEVEIVTDAGKTYSAKVVGTDPRTDVALLKVDGKDFPFVPFAEKSPRIGDWVLAVGNPFGLGGTVTAGIVSARGRDIGSGPYDDFIQIDAPINKGNSGGPTFNTNGEVIGVNTAIYSPSGGNVGIAFAIPAETVQQVVAQLHDKGAVTRGYIGVQIQPVTKDIAESLGLKADDGALVASVQPGSPAEKAKLRASDVITAVDGDAVKGPRELTRKIGALKPGSSVTLTVNRDGKDEKLSLTLATLPGDGRTAEAATSQQGETQDIPRLGLQLKPAGEREGGKGLVVTDMDPSGLAARKGVRPGDVIVEVAGKPVSSLGEMRDALRQAGKDGRSAALIRLQSGKDTRFVAVPLKNQG